jgi:hypothetical protein
MEFGQKLTIMRWIRDMKVDVLAKKIMLDPGILCAIVRGDITASAALEKRIRQALGWPTEVDELLEIIVRATYKNGSDVNTPHPSLSQQGEGVTQAPKSEPIPVTASITVNPPQVLKKKMGRPRKVRPEVTEVLGDGDGSSDDGDEIEVGELRGSVVA